MRQQRNIPSISSTHVAAPLGLPRAGLLRPKTQLTRCQPVEQQPPLAEQQSTTEIKPSVQQAVSEVPAAVAKSILARRSVIDDDALHRPLGLVAFGAYVLGSAASLVGEWSRLGGGSGWGCSLSSSRPRA